MTCLKQGIKAVQLTSVMRTFPDVMYTIIFSHPAPIIGWSSLAFNTNTMIIYTPFCQFAPDSPFLLSISDDTPSIEILDTEIISSDNLVWQGYRMI